MSIFSLQGMNRGDIRHFDLRLSEAKNPYQSFLSAVFNYAKRNGWKVKTFKRGDFIMVKRIS
jgi:hypothetical protein